jgi:hypothetical protein
VPMHSRTRSGTRDCGIGINEDHALLRLLTQVVIDDLSRTGAHTGENFRSASGMPSRSKVRRM